MVRRTRVPSHPNTPGWYPDGAGRLRYFDGIEWTENVRQRPTLISFRSETPLPDRSLALRVKRPNRRSQFAKLFLAFILVGGVVLELIVITVSDANPPAFLSRSQYYRVATKDCRSDLSNMNLLDVSVRGRQLSEDSLDLLANSLEILANEAPKVTAATEMAEFWSTAAADWASYADGVSKPREERAIAAINRADAISRSTGLKICVVNTHR